MKRLISLFTVCLLMAGTLCTLSVSAAGSLSVTANATNVTVGQNVTVTLAYDGGGQAIGGITGYLHYDTTVFSYVSFGGKDVEIKGNPDGVIKYIYSPSDAVAPNTATITFTFKSLVPGACTFNVVEPEEFVNDTDYSSLGSPTGSVTVTANNPTLSNNANLKSLVPSKGTLNPKFDPNVTKYTISVANSVTSLSLDAKAAEGRVTSISGKNALAVGKNTRVITVTAPNGDTKKYTVVITRAAAPSTTGGTNRPTGTTAPLPPDDALEVSVGGKAMTILDTQAPTDLPDGFRWGTVTINLVEVPAAIHEQTEMTLLYLVSEDKAGDGFYVYDAATDSFAKFRLLTVADRGWLLYDLPSGKAFAGTVVGSLIYEGDTISAFVYEDATLSDFCIVWAAPLDGTAGWYTFDKKEGTLQRHHLTPQNGEGGTTPSSTQKPTASPDKEEDKPDKEAFSFASMMENYRKPLLIGIVALCGIVVVVIFFLLIVSGGRNKGKHRKGKH